MTETGLWRIELRKRQAGSDPAVYDRHTLHWRGQDPITWTEGWIAGTLNATGERWYVETASRVSA